MGTKPKRGRPPLDLAGLSRVCVFLDRQTIARARKAGAGNLSAGLRTAVQAWIPKK